jgi:hypothetical protein
MKSIHPALFVVSVLLNFLAIKLAAQLLPGRFYFTFSAFLFDGESVFRLEALVLKLALPLATAAAIMASLARARATRLALTGEARAIEALLADQAKVTLVYAAFLAAFLMAWPYILLWDALIDPTLASWRMLYLLSYAVYLVGYAFMARAGVEAVEAWTGLAPSGAGAGDALGRLIENPAAKPVVTALSGAIASAVAAFLIGTRP